VVEPFVQLDGFCQSDILVVTTLPKTVPTNPSLSNGPVAAIVVPPSSQILKPAMQLKPAKSKVIPHPDEPNSLNTQYP